MTGGSEIRPSDHFFRVERRVIHLYIAGQSGVTSHVTATESFSSLEIAPEQEVNVLNDIRNINTLGPAQLDSRNTGQ